MEIDFKHWLRSGFVWSNQVEYGRGGQDGFPDVVALVRNEMLPIECKTGVIKNGLWKIDKHPILPSQVKWHYEYAAAGGVSCIAIGWYSEIRRTWEMLMVPGFQVMKWKSGYRMMKDVQPRVVNSVDIESRMEIWLKHMKGR